MQLLWTDFSTTELSIPSDLVFRSRFVIPCSGESVIGKVPVPKMGVVMYPVGIIVDHENRHLTLVI